MGTPKNPMQIGVWGPNLWTFLHTYSFQYGGDNGIPTNSEREKARTFFTNLQDVIPCKICRGHYAKHISLHPPDVENRDTLSRWVVMIHNIVNVNTGKPQVPYEHVREHYMGGQQRLAEENDEVCALKAQVKASTVVNYALGGVLFLVLASIVVWLCLRNRTIRND